MNQEMMGLYKENGVNPASGCVPMLLTMPVLFGFYAMLAVAIELRGAPFFGWIHDLAKMDPLFITPILMGASMFVQQRMTPTTADPAQQKIFMFMPIIFTVIFPWARDGLRNLDVLVLDCVRLKPHSTHLHLDEALGIIEDLKPKRAYLTHLNHDILHERDSNLLPANVYFAHDGLVVESV